MKNKTDKADKMNKFSKKAVASRAVGRPQKDDTASVRDSLLDAAVELFSRNTVAATAIKAISTKAGATPAMVYYYFKNKEELIDAVVKERIMPRFYLIFSVIRDKHSDPLFMLDGVQERIIDMVGELPWFLPLWSREIINESGILRQYVLKYIDKEAFNLFRLSIAKGQRDGVINRDLVPEMVFVSLISMTLIPLLTKDIWKDLAGVDSGKEAYLKHIRSFLLHGAGGGK